MNFEDKKNNIKPLSRFEILNYYSRKDILDQILKISNQREFVGAFIDGSYSKRPNVIQYPSDIIQMVKLNVTSFHCSVERWSNPMQLSIETKNYNTLRTGFDFLIDIDSEIGIKAAQICASMVCKFLKDYGIKNYGIKFSGSRGFHIIIPYEAFPSEVNYKKLSLQYPKIPRTLAGFIREKIRDKLTEKLVKEYTAKGLFELMPADDLNPFHWVDIERGWGERHLFRVPYSLNEKTWLVSLPIKDPWDFEIEKTKINKIKVSESFIKPCENEALDLLIDALDWNTKIEETRKKSKKITKKTPSAVKVPETLFPPCVKNILRGLSDGKKRSTFTLISFLRTMNWSREEVEAKIEEWNKKNSPALPTSFILGQLNWNYRQREIFPASCENELFYKSIGICQPDETCKKIKNPMTYSFKKLNRTKIKENITQCRICEKRFKSEKSLKTHQSKVHGDRIL